MRVEHINTQGNQILGGKPNWEKPLLLLSLSSSYCKENILLHILLVQNIISAQDPTY